MTRVLVVDDSQMIRNYMAECLTALGFSNIEFAVNGAKALEISETALPDLITLDWNMPVMDGLQYLKKLRQLPGGDKPVVVFCSTEGSARKIELVMNSGANAYITKPFDLFILREKLIELGVLPS